MITYQVILQTIFLAIKAGNIPEALRQCENAILETAQKHNGYILDDDDPEQNIFIRLGLSKEEGEQIRSTLIEVSRRVVDKDKGFISKIQMIKYIEELNLSERKKITLAYLLAEGIHHVMGSMREKMTSSFFEMLLNGGEKTFPEDFLSKLAEKIRLARLKKEEKSPEKKKKKE